VDGRVHSDFLGRERDIAAAAIDRALMLNPNAALAWAARGYVFCSRGQADAAIDACERAMRLSPIDPLHRVFAMGMSLAHQAAGRYEEALDWVEQILHAEPGYMTALLRKAEVCAHLGRIEDARAAVRQLLEAQPWRSVARTQPWLLRAHGPEWAARSADALRKAGLPEE
jgi:adenylate cyclase